MTEQEASLIIRQHIALVEEGISAWRTSDANDQDIASDSDDEVLREAVRVGGHLFREDELRDHWLK